MEKRAPNPLVADKSVQKRTTYERKRERMAVSFNMERVDEAALHEYAKTLNFSVWVKEQLALELNEK